MVNEMKFEDMKSLKFETAKLVDKIIQNIKIQNHIKIRDRKTG